jgi:hypothetical protein
MAIKRRKFQLGVRLKPTTQPTVDNGDISVSSVDNKIKTTTYTYAEFDVLTPYSVGDKVKYSPENKNYVCTQAGTGNLPTNTDFWEVYEQSIVTEDQDQTLTNKTIDGTVAGGANNIVKTDSVKVAYDDTNEPVSSLGNNLQAALDAVKVALDGQNEASEMKYDATASGLDTADANSNVQDAIDDLDANVDDLVTLSGVAENSADLGTFTGTTIADNQTVKAALQDIETAHEDHTAATEAHGATGAVMGTTNTQTVQNKTLDNTNTIDGATIQNASIEKPSKLEVKQDEESDLITYAGTTNNGQIVFATDTKKMYQIIDNELEPIGGGGSTSFEISQTTHGFAVGDGIYHDPISNTWVKAQADDPDTLAYHVVVQGSETDVDLFIAADFGRIIEVPLGDNSIHSLVAGEYYFLSDSVAGKPTNVEPSTFSNPLFYVESIDATDVNNQIAVLQIKCLRPEQVGADTNLDDISDVSASTAVQDDFLKYNGSIWEPSRVTEQVISLVAAEGLSARDAVYVNASGQAAKVDADDDNKIEFIGFARASALISESVEIVVSGKLAGFSGLTPGEFVYADPSTPGAVVQPEPIQANVYLIKVGKAISATEILVNPDLASSAEFNREVVADQTILNNQSVAQSITGLSFDGATYRAVVLRYAIYRVTDDNEVAQTGQLRLTYKTNAASWSITDDFGGDDAGVTFSVDATGQILYTSTDLTGANYSSSLKVNTVELFEI